MRPPIASPVGDAENVSAGDKSERIALGASISFSDPAACTGRKLYKEVLTEPASVGTVLFVATILTLILLPVIYPSVSFWELWFLFFSIFPLSVILLVTPFSLLASRRQKTVIFTPYGVSRYEGEKEVEIAWSAFLGIANWSGDVILTTFASQIFVPREAFASRVEAAEFAQIAHELRKSRGAAWRDEWKGKVFGAKPEIERQNLPK